MNQNTHDDHDGNLRYSYVTKDDLKQTHNWLNAQQKEIKQITSTLTDIVATQKEMQGAFGHFTTNFGLIREDIQRIFDSRSNDMNNARPNYFAWVIGGVTVIATMMAFVVTFVSLVLQPIKADQSDLKVDIQAVDYRVTNHQVLAENRVQISNEYKGRSGAEIENLRGDVDWLHDQVVDMIKSRHTAADEIRNQDINRSERERISNKK